MTPQELRDALERWRLGQQPKQRVFRITPLWGSEILKEPVTEFQRRPDGVWEMP